MKTKWLMSFIAGFLSVSSVVFPSLHDGTLYHLEIPMDFSNANIPYIEVDIEGMAHHLEIDTGSLFALSMTKELLGKIDKKELVGMNEWWDLAGNRYESPTYLLSSMSIGDITASDIPVQQEDDDFVTNNTFKDKNEEEEDKQGTIGWPFLCQMNLLFDCRNYKFRITNNNKKLLDEGYYLHEMTKVPFELNDGIVLQVETDFGVKRAMLDTGCTLNHIRSSLVREKASEKGKFDLPQYFSSKFVMGTEDFGKMGFYHYEFDTEVLEDIILGMEFMDEHVIYLDFYNKFAYIGKSE